MSMLNTFSAKTYNRIRNTEGNTFMENTNVLRNEPVMRRTNVQSSNDILSAGYSFQKFAKDASKGIKAVDKVVPKEIKDQIKREAINAAKNYLLPAAEAALPVAEEAAPALLLAAGRKGVAPKALKPWVEHVKAYQKAHKCTYKEAMIGAKASYKKK